MANMYNVIPSNLYRKDLKLAKKRGLNISLLDDVVDKLARGETLPERHCDHMLQGELDGYRECHIKPDWLLIYQIINNDLILLLSRTGTHSDLF